MLRAHKLIYPRRGGPTGVKGRGQPVPPDAVTHRVVLGSGDLVGLADAGSYFGKVYVAISHDGGSTWAIDSPLFYYSAAQGPATTTALARTPSGLVVAWGHDGNFVKVTQDKGRSWFETDFLDGVDTLIVSGNRLIVHELQFTSSGTQLPDLTYISNATGHIWQLEGRA